MLNMVVKFNVLVNALFSESLNSLFIEMVYKMQKFRFRTKKHEKYIRLLDVHPRNLLVVSLI